MERMIPIKRIYQQEVEESAMRSLDAFLPLLREIEKDDSLQNWRDPNGNLSFNDNFCAFACSYMILQPGDDPVSFILSSLKRPFAWDPGAGAIWKGQLFMGEFLHPVTKGILGLFALQTRTDGKELADTFLYEVLNQNLPIISSVPRHLDSARKRSHQVVIHGYTETELIITDPDRNADYTHHPEDIRVEGDHVYIQKRYWDTFAAGIYLCWAPSTDASVIREKYSPYIRFSEQLADDE